MTTYNKDGYPDVSKWVEKLFWLEHFVPYVDEDTGETVTAQDEYMSWLTEPTNHPSHEVRRVFAILIDCADDGERNLEALINAVDQRCKIRARR